ncbi:MAG: winged helix-turn-helix transcriptional regulator [Natronomonas sp.]
MDEIDQSKRTTLKRFAALGAATPLLGRSEDTSDTRGAIVGYLATTPGAHFSKLRDDLKLGTGETQHHLRRLETSGDIETMKDGDYRRYFLADRFSDFEKHALGYLRRETPRRMLVALLSDPSATGTDLAAAADVSPSTVSKYASELAETGLLSRDDGYAIEQPETLLTLLVRYADSFGPAAVELADGADSLVVYDPSIDG